MKASFILFIILLCSIGAHSKEYCCTHLTTDFKEGIALAKEHKKDIFVMVFEDSDSLSFNKTVKKSLKMGRHRYKRSLRSLSAEFVVIKTYQSDLTNFINTLNHKFLDLMKEAAQKNKGENYVFITTENFNQVYSPLPFWNRLMIADLIYVKFGP